MGGMGVFMFGYLIYIFYLFFFLFFYKVFFFVIGT